MFQNAGDHTPAEEVVERTVAVRTQDYVADAVFFRLLQNVVDGKTDQRDGFHLDPGSLQRFGQSL